MVQTTLSCRYAAIHLVYLGIYTREDNYEQWEDFSYKIGQTVYLGVLDGYAPKLPAKKRRKIS